MSAEACPPPLWVRLRIRAELPGQPALTLEGMLQAVAPESLRLTARFGAWRPAFVLLARPDSSELLVHEAARYWVAPREAPDWATLDAAAWASALAWTLCPGEFFREFLPREAGRIEDGRWTVNGGLARTSWGVRVTLNIRTRALLALEVADGDVEVARIRASGHETAAGAWLPERLEISRPVEGLRVRIDRVGAGRLSGAEMPSFELLYPSGWTRGRAGGIELQPPAVE